MFAEDCRESAPDCPGCLRPLDEFVVMADHCPYCNTLLGDQAITSGTTDVIMMPTGSVPRRRRRQ